jgi:pentose-5-phosphate-3-epimerase
LNVNNKNMNKEIIPAVLPENIEEIETLVRRLDRLGGYIQIDICDGSFVNAQTWPYVRHILPEFKDGFELPGWEYFDFELDLMVKNPELLIDNIKNLGISRAVLHVKSTTFEGFMQAAKKLAFYDIEVGIGIENTCTSYDQILEALKEEGIEHYAQVMGIDTIGKQGEPFSDKSLELVQKIHAQYPELTLQVDGAVSASTASVLSDAGVSRFVVGSWLSTGHAKDKVQELKSLI